MFNLWKKLILICSLGLVLVVAIGIGLVWHYQSTWEARVKSSNGDETVVVYVHSHWWTHDMVGEVEGRVKIVHRIGDDQRTIHDEHICEMDDWRDPMIQWNTREVIFHPASGYGSRTAF